MSKTHVWEREGSACWLMCLGFGQRYDHVMKSELRQNFAKLANSPTIAKVFENKFWPSCEITFRPYFVFFWFHESNKI